MSHIESRTRWFALAKLTSDCASATLKFWPWTSFWPIITVAPSRCQVCRVLSLMPYCGVDGAELLGRGVQRVSASLFMWSGGGGEV